MTDSSKKTQDLQEAEDFTILLEESAQMAEEESITVEYLTELDAINQMRVVIEQVEEESYSYQTSS